MSSSASSFLQHICNTRPAFPSSTEEASCVLSPPPPPLCSDVGCGGSALLHLQKKMSCKERRGKRRAPPFVQEGKIERRRRRQLCSQRKRKKGEERPLSLSCDPRAFCLNGCEEGEGGCLRWESRRGSDCCSGKGIAITFEVRQQRQPQTQPTYNALRRRRRRGRLLGWLDDAL